MVYPQIHISRKLSHFLTTLGVKAVLCFLEMDFCCLCLFFFFIIMEAFRLWKFVRGKGQSEFCQDWSPSVLRTGRKEPSRVFFFPSQKEEIIVVFVLRLSGSEIRMAQLLLSFKDLEAAQLVISSTQALHGQKKRCIWV